MFHNGTGIICLLLKFLILQPFHIVFKLKARKYIQYNWKYKKCLIIVTIIVKAEVLNWIALRKFHLFFFFMSWGPARAKHVLFFFFFFKSWGPARPKHVLFKYLFWYFNIKAQIQLFMDTVNYKKIMWMLPLRGYIVWLY